MSKNTNSELFLSRLLRRGVETLIQLSSDMTDAQRVELAELHRPWGPQGYRPNEFVTHGISGTTGRAIVYRSNRNVSAGAQSPEVSTSWTRLPGQ
jgi:hypothetical protein